ncbi:hypothetical protein Q1695_007823 [Nippostrongylus brasiliensis]|nr:hypothetical protein Q1695_007823 [Nippostrongylus brasiliensis]
MISTRSVILLTVFITSGFTLPILKREVDLLDMMRTPLVLSFNRNNAFFSPRDRQNDFVSRMLRIPGGRRLLPSTSE